MNLSILLICVPNIVQKLDIDPCFEQEEDVVFMETHKQLRKQHHMVIECIPLPKEIGDMSPIYFKVCPSKPVYSINSRILSRKN